MIEFPFDCQIDGETYHCAPGNDPRSLGPALALHNRTVASASIDADGTIQITFYGGAALTVHSDPYYEAWNLTGPGNLIVVCGPDGLISIFE